MKNKTRISFIVAVVSAVLVTCCSTSPSGHRDVAHSDAPPPTSAESTLNDRSTWIDWPVAPRVPSRER